MKETFLPNHKDYKIYQDDGMIGINTDTMLLGEFVEVYKEDTVLDFGTNTGALLLYASMFKPKKLIGVDINKQALDLAKMNMEVNNITNYELICNDITTYKNDEVDVIICNPPYFKTSDDNKSDNKALNLAKHEDSLTLDKLIVSIRRNLKNYGTLFMLFQTSRMQEVFTELTKNKFRIKEIKLCYDENKESSNVFLLKAVKGGSYGVVAKKPVIIKH